MSDDEQSDLEIVSETVDMLVINKPAGVPIHPTGRYIKNSLTTILEHELGYKVYGEFFFFFFPARNHCKLKKAVITRPELKLRLQGQYKTLLLTDLTDLTD